MIQIRRAKLDDVPALVYLRKALFKEMGLLKGNKDGLLFEKVCKNYFKHSIPKEEFLAWIAENDGKIVATGGLVFFQKPPDPRNRTGKEAYLINFYTLPEWRRLGIASQMIDEIFSYLKRLGITLFRLHTTEIARNIYEKNGFSFVDNEMVLMER